MGNSTTRLILVGTLAFIAAFWSSAAPAGYPEKPIKIIVPYSPGGTTDVLVRTTARFLEQTLGQSIIIVNIKGAGGSVGMLEAVNSKPDGYTFGMYLTNTEVTQAVKVAAFTDDDFEPACLLGDVFLTVTIKGDGPYKSLKDYQDAARKNPGEIGLSMGVGTLAQFSAAMVEEAMGVDLKLVNAGGGAQKKASVLGGHVEALIEPTPGVLGPHEAGQLRIAAILSPERLEFLPDLPTAKEQGVDVVSAQTNGFFVPKGTPQDRIATFCAALEKVTQDPAFIKKSRDMSLLVTFKEGAAFRQHIKDVRKTIFAIGSKLGYQ